VNVNNKNMDDNKIIWGECCGYDIGYDFDDVPVDCDCLVLVESEWCSQIDTSFDKREGLDLKMFSPRPFGCWRIKKEIGSHPTA